MRSLVRRIIRGDRAQDAAEYGIALAVIGTVAGMVALVIATQVGSIWNPVDSIITVVHGKAHGDHGNGNGNGKGHT